MISYLIIIYYLQLSKIIALSVLDCFGNWPTKLIIIRSLLMRKQQTKLTASLEQDCLTIQLLNSSSKQVYECKVRNLGDAQGLSNWFDGLGDLRKHLDNQKNYKVSFGDCSINLQVIGKHPTKQQSFIHIASLILPLKVQQKIGLQANNSLENVIAMCNKSEELSDKDLRVMVKILTESLQQLRNRQASNTNTVAEQPKHNIEKLMQMNSQNLQRYQQQLDNFKSLFSKQLNQIKTQLLQQLDQRIKADCKFQSYVSSNQSQHQNQAKSKIQTASNSHQKQIQQINSKIITKLSQQIKQKDQVVEIIIKKMNNNFQARDLRMDKLQDRLQVIQNKITALSQKAIQVGLLNHQTKAEKFIDRQCFSFKHLILQGNRITKFGGKQADIFSKIKIQGKFKYSIQVMELNGWLCVGVADSQLKHKQTFSNQPNCIVLYNDGNFYNGIGMRGKIVKGFQKYDVITVHVDRTVGKIQWVIDNEVKLSYNYEKLKNNAIDWVPYVWAISNGTSIRVVQ